MLKIFFYVLVFVIFRSSIWCINILPESVFEIEKSNTKFISFLEETLKDMGNNDECIKLINEISSMATKLNKKIKILEGGIDLATFNHGLEENEFDKFGFPKKDTELRIMIHPQISPKIPGIASAFLSDSTNSKLLCMSSYVARKMNIPVQTSDNKRSALSVITCGYGYFPFYTILAHELVHLKNFLKTLCYQKNLLEQKNDLTYGQSISIKNIDSYISALLVNRLKDKEQDIKNIESFVISNSTICTNICEFYKTFAKDRPSARAISTIFQPFTSLHHNELHQILDYRMLKAMCREDFFQQLIKKAKNILRTEKEPDIELTKTDSTNISLILSDLEKQTKEMLPESTDFFVLDELCLNKEFIKLPWPNFEERRTVLGYLDGDISEFSIKLKGNLPVRYFYDEMEGMLCLLESTFTKILKRNNISIDSYQFIDDLSYISGVSEEILEESLNLLPLVVRLAVETEDQLLRDEDFRKNLKAKDKLRQYFSIDSPTKEQIPITPKKFAFPTYSPIDSLHTPKKKRILQTVMIYRIN